jgi:HlyD family secretion protein
MGALLALGAGALYALRAAPIPVEVATVGYGPLQITVEDQAETRSHDRYVVAAPVAGRLLRVLLRDGDPVTAGQSVATLAPVPLSARELEEALAAVQSAAATERSARAQLEHTRQDLEQARRDLVRLNSLSRQGLAPMQTLEHARTAVSSLEMELAAAHHRALAAAAQLRGAQAALSAIRTLGPAHQSTLTVHAPAAGRVLRVLEPSERVIGSGTPIMVIGDLRHLEVVMEMLSTQAVRVQAGMSAEILNWGGDYPLRARVRRVEPYAFTKISALGVEEKRSNVILDFLDSPATLGDGYRVEVRIVLWSAAHVLQAPLSATFRCPAGWCVYVLAGNRARLQSVRIGQRNEEAVQILSGLLSGERVITHPPNDLVANARVTVRP